MTTLREAAAAALEAMEKATRFMTDSDYKRLNETIEVLKAALAEPQEPVAGVVLNEEGRPALVEHGQEDWHCANRKARRLYTHPAPQRQPLTEDEAWDMWDALADRGKKGEDIVHAFARAIERAHGITGETK